MNRHLSPAPVLLLAAGQVPAQTPARPTGRQPRPGANQWLDFEIVN